MITLYASALGSLYQGHALDALRGLPACAARCCVTSPPYWGLRDYGVAGQIGLEPTPEAYIDRLCEVFAELWRVLANDGTLWLNLGDSYSSNVTKRGVWDPAGTKQAANPGSLTAPSRTVAELGPKQLVGIPWRVAFALQEMGWILRSEIIWHKPNPMPESVRDRPTRAHEYMFLLSKSERYYYDHEAVREPAAALNEHDHTGQGGYRAPGQPEHKGNRPKMQHPSALSFAREVREPDRPGQKYSQHRPERDNNRGYPEPRNNPERGLKRRAIRPGIDNKGGGQGRGEIHYPLYTRNRRSVWTIPARPFHGAHFATFPPALVEPCILAGCPMGGTVLDPFFGSGTVGEVAQILRRQWMGIELNPETCALAARRVQGLPPKPWKGDGAFVPPPLMQLLKPSTI